MKPKKNHKRMSQKKKQKISQDRLEAAATKPGHLPVQKEPIQETVADIQRPVSRVSRLNQRFVLLVAICSLVLAAGMHWVRSYQLDRNAEIYRDRATTLQEEGKPNEAIIYLSRYLRFRPDDVDALATLGKLINEGYSDRWSKEHVFLTFEEVVSRDPDRSDIRRELIYVAMQLGRVGSALGHIKILREKSPDDDDGELAYWSATCHQEEGDLEDAVKDYSKSIDQSQNAFEHYAGFASFVAKEFDNLMPEGRARILTVCIPQNEKPANVESPSNEEEPPQPNAVVVADHLLDLMVHRGQPAYRARLARATFPYPEDTFTSHPALQQAEAEKQATSVLEKLDTKKKDELLDHTEWMTAPFVPSVVDSDGDRRISHDELKDYYEKGAVFARLDLARKDLEVALKDVEFPLRNAQDALKDVEDALKLKYSVDLDFANSKERSDALDEKNDVLKGKSLALRVAAQISITLGQETRQQRKTVESNPHFQQARQYAENGSELELMDLRFYLLLSEIEVLEGNPDDAENHLRDALGELYSLSEEERQKQKKSLDDDIEEQLQWALADLLLSKLESIQTGASPSELPEDQKKELAGILEKLDKSQPRVKYLNGRMLFSKREFQHAGLRLQEARRDLEGDVALRRKLDRFLAVCYRRLRNPDAQMDVFRRALKQDPLWVELHVRLGTALAANNRGDDALREFQLASSVPGVPTAIAGLLLRKQAALSESSQKAGWEEIQSALDAEIQLSKRYELPLSANVPILRAESLRLQEDYAEAKNILETFRDENPEDAIIWAALSNFHVQNTDLDEAEKTLSEAHEKLGDRIEFRLAAMQIAIAKPVDEAERILKTIESETQKNFEKQSERIQILKGLAAAYMRISSNENVSKIWSQLAVMQPDDLRTLMVLAEFALMENDTKKLRDVLQNVLPGIIRNIRNIEGDDGPNGNYIEAMKLLREAEQKFKNDKIPFSKSQKVVKARDLLTRAATQRPSWDAVPSTLGHLENTLNNRDAAVVHYRKALDAGSRSKKVIVPLIQILRIQQRYDEANQILSQLTKENPSLVSGELARIHSFAASQLGQRDEALRIAIENAKNSDDVLNKILEAEIRFVGGERGNKVEKLLTTAVENATGDQSKHLRVATIALVMYLSKVDKLDGADGADEVIENAEKNLPAEPPYLAPLTLAYCYEALNLPGREDKEYLEKAEKLYLNALKPATGGDKIKLQMAIVGFYMRTTEFGEAKVHLSQIKDSKKPLGGDVKDWANQQLAIIQASLGGYAGTKIALGMLTSDSDLRAKAALLSRLSFKEHRFELIDVLKRIETTFKLTQKERLQLAQLYETTGDWPKSRETIQLLLDDDQFNPQLLEYAVLALLRHHHDDDRVLLKAGRLVDRLLDATEPDSFRTKTTQVRLLAAQDQADDAVKLLKEYLGPNPDDQKIANMNSAASLLEELGQSQIENTIYLQAADEMYRKYAELSPNPQAVLPLISFLGQRKKHAEALDLCEKSWETVPTDFLAAVAMATIRDGKVTGRYVQMVEQRLKTALQKDRNSLPLLLILADLRDYQGQYDKMEPIYRRMLDIDPYNVVALNNISWFLAMRQQRGGEALLLIERAINTAGPVSELLDTYAVVLLAANKPQKALKTLKKAIEQNPSSIKTFHLAQVHFKLSNISESRKALKKVEDEGNWDEMHPLERKEWKKLKQDLAHR